MAPRLASTSVPSRVTLTSLEFWFSHRRPPAGRSLNSSRGARPGAGGWGAAPLPIAEADGGPGGEDLPDGSEAPAVAAVELAQHDRVLRGEVAPGQRVARDLVPARDDPQVAGTELGHRAGAVDRPYEREPVDVGGDLVEGG